MDRHDGVLSIELAREHRPDLAGLHVPRVRIEALGKVGRHVFALARPLDEYAEVISLAAERFGERSVVFELAPALKCLLCDLLIFPEVRGRNLCLDLGQFALQAGFVKAPSADRWRVRPGRRGCESFRRGSWLSQNPA
jgi:hypothetical protein